MPSDTLPEIIEQIKNEKNLTIEKLNDFQESVKNILSFNDEFSNEEFVKAHAERSTALGRLATFLKNEKDHQKKESLLKIKNSIQEVTLFRAIEKVGDFAAENGDATPEQTNLYKVIKLLAGLDPNVKNSHDFTPLMVAAQLGNLKVVKILLLNQNLDLRFNMMAVELAEESGAIDVCKKICETHLPQVNKLLFSAASTGDLAMVKEYLNMGGTAFYRDENNKTVAMIEHEKCQKDHSRSKECFNAIIASGLNSKVPQMAEKIFQQILDEEFEVDFFTAENLQTMKAKFPGSKIAEEIDEALANHEVASPDNRMAPSPTICRSFSAADSSSTISNGRQI